MTSSSNPYDKYSGFDTMSTEELKALLRSDSVNEEDESSTGIILYISELILERESESLAEEFNIDTAWESFKSNYHPDYCVDIGDEVEANSETIIAIKPLVKSRKRKLPIICIAAVVGLILAGTITAGAFGYNFWGSTATWNKVQLSFSELGLVHHRKHEWLDILYEQGISEPVSPDWLPERFTAFNGINIETTPRKIVCMGYYTCDDSDDYFKIIISKRSVPSTTVYEKDDTEIKIFTYNKIDHYIYHNVDRWGAVWMTGDIEVSFVGNVSYEEMKKIIKSVY